MYVVKICMGIFLFIFVDCHGRRRYKPKRKNNMYSLKLQLIICWICLCLFPGRALSTIATNDPLAIFLTWQEDPTTSMVIDWHTTQRSYLPIYYRERGQNNWLEVPGKLYAFPHSDRVIHRVSLERLNTGTAYEVKFSEDSEAIISGPCLPILSRKR